MALTLPLLVASCESSKSPPDGGSSGGGGNCAGTSCGDHTCGSEPCEQEGKDSCQLVGCETNETCQPDGNCLVSAPDIEVENSGGSGAGSTGEGGAPGCVDVRVNYQKVIPTVALLIDRSRSMNDLVGFGEEVEAEIEAGSYQPWGCPEQEGAALDAQPQENPTWRWNVVRNVLFHPETGVVPLFQDQVAFGLTLYTYQPDVTPELCPELDQVDFGLGNSSELLALMACHDLGYKTPTREALAATAAALNNLESTGPKVIILATDGAPNSCECPSFTESQSIPTSCWPSTTVERDGTPLTPPLAEQFDVTSEAARIFEDWGIRTSVIDVSSESDVDLRAHLTQVAQAGGGKLYDGLNPTGLSDAFATSVDEVRSCAVDLNGEIVAGNEDRGTVVFDGVELPVAMTESEDGYRVLSSTRIELSGKPCEDLKSGDHALAITFPCDAFEVVK